MLEPTVLPCQPDISRKALDITGPWFSYRLQAPVRDETMPTLISCTVYITYQKPWHIVWNSSRSLCRRHTQKESAVKLSPKRACERPCSRMSSTTSLFSSRLEMISSIAFMTTMPWICKTALLASRPRGAQLAVWSSSISRNFSNVSLTAGLLSNILHNNERWCQLARDSSITLLSQADTKRWRSYYIINIKTEVEFGPFRWLYENDDYSKW